MPRKKQYSEEEVIEKAVKVFWNNGYSSTSIRQLENEMGINQFSIYSSFGNKKGVFLRALEQYKLRVKDIFLADLVKSEGKLKDIKKFLNAFVQSVKSGRTPNGCLMANTAMDLGAKDYEIKIQIKLFFELLKEVFTEVLNKAKVRKELPESANVERFANFLLVCTEGLAVTSKILEENELKDFIDVTMKSLE